MKLAAAVAFAILATAALAGGWQAIAEQGKVTGTAHDLGTPGETGVSSCETCHVPHEEQGQVLWEGDPRQDGEFTGLAPLCYSCHDGTVADGSYAFDQGLAQHPVEPGEPGQDCDLCHDPHISDYGSFVLFPSGANLCQACHEHASEADHPVNVKLSEAKFAPSDTHRDPNAGDLSGARLWDRTGRTGSEYTKCLTCHAAHAGSPAESLLSIDPADAVSTTPALCKNCHSGK
jgi:predicted CXXCH cytochrome family protein